MESLSITLHIHVVYKHRSQSRARTHNAVYLVGVFCFKRQVRRPDPNANTLSSAERIKMPLVAAHKLSTVFDIYSILFGIATAIKQQIQRVCVLWVFDRKWNDN